ncbi:MAG: hypothetical protein ACYS6Z_18635, partial [Planctomycetota bacterium]
MARHAFLFLLLLLLPALGQDEGEVIGGEDEEETTGQEESGEEESRCTCRDGNASYRSLGSPRRPPGDPPWCPVARRDLSCKLWKAPKGLGEGYRAANMRSFLLRHAVSWQIECSLCAQPKDKKKALRPEHADAAAAARSQKKIGGKRIEVAMSPYYVFVTDIPRLKIITDGGGIRMATHHELLHLYLQRAETA